MITWKEKEWPAAAVTFVTLMTAAEAETLIAYGRFVRQRGRLGGAARTKHGALQVLEPTGAGRLQGIAQEELAGPGSRRRAQPCG